MSESGIETVASSSSSRAPLDFVGEDRDTERCDSPSSSESFSKKFSRLGDGDGKIFKTDDMTGENKD